MPSLLRVLLLFLLCAILTPKDADAQRRGKLEDRGYVDLIKDEKKELRTLTFLRKQCFFSQIRKNDDFKLPPKRLAKVAETFCPEHEEKIKKVMLEQMKMNEDFVHDYIRTIQEDVLVSLVPYILKYRNEQRELRERLQQ